MFRQLLHGKIRAFTVLKSNKLIVVAYWHVSTLHHTGIVQQERDPGSRRDHVGDTHSQGAG